MTEKDYEKAWQEKLARLKNGESIEEVGLTVREFDFLIERAENFRGKFMDMTRYKRWLALEDAVSELCKINEEFNANYSPPTRTKRHAVLGLLVPTFMTYEYEERDLLIGAIKNTDCISIVPMTVENENYDIVGIDWSTVVIGMRIWDVWMDEATMKDSTRAVQTSGAGNRPAKAAKKGGGVSAANAWAEKLKRAQNGEKVEFTDDELRAILAQNRALQDKEVNLACFRSWVALTCAAEALSRKNKNYTVRTWPPTESEGSGFVSLFFPCYDYISGTELHLLITMMEAAHTVRFTPTTPVSPNRAVIQFSVDEIWDSLNLMNFLD